MKTTSAGACAAAPGWCGLAPHSTDASAALVKSLSRHFHVAENEKEVWAEVLELRERLETLGHVVASTALNSVPPSEQKSAHAEKKLHVGIVAPSTSNGLPVPSNLEHTDPDSIEKGGLDVSLKALPLYAALLRSLYASGEPNYDYTVYVAANEGDPLLDDKVKVSRLFLLAANEFLEAGEENDGLGDHQEEGRLSAVQFKLLVLPRPVVPSRSLSALFNLPTLAAVADGVDYVYLANDDLDLASDGWTTKFVDALQSNAVWPNLGVAGAIDTSDTVTPQIEFPFFHRTHAILFPWCGANPWVFRNWFEDNWITDVYAPFGKSVFYFDNVIVQNYGGLMRSAKVSGATDPRYKLVGGRRVPDFYLGEVHSGRRRIREALVSWGVSPSSLPIDLQYCPKESLPGSRPASLGLMPVGPHQHVLDPCGGPNTHGRQFERSALELYGAAHRPYLDVLAAYGADPYDTGLPLPLQAADYRSSAPGECTSRAECDGTPLSAVSPKSLDIAVLHHHIPLYSRYGCDKRLSHIIASLLALGHRVRYGGKHASDFETAEDKVEPSNVALNSQFVYVLTIGKKMSFRSGFLRWAFATLLFPWHMAKMCSPCS